jgi:hypothetical protein
MLEGRSRPTFAGAHVVQGEVAMGFDRLFLDTDHHVALAGVRRVAMGFDQTFSSIQKTRWR